MSVILLCRKTVEKKKSLQDEDSHLKILDSLRCLADSNRRARFCRPVTKPLIQGTIYLNMMQRYNVCCNLPNVASSFLLIVRCRGDPTRTGDHLVPNQVRYQLRYTPNLLTLSWKAMQRYFFIFNCARNFVFFYTFCIVMAFSAKYNKVYENFSVFLHVKWL